MNPWLTIALQAEPLAVTAIKALIGLFKKYPALTPEQISQAVTQAANSADAAFDDVLAKIAADQAPKVNP
jgi:uncharacterized protein YpuA (DUF1002 family)